MIPPCCPFSGAPRFSDNNVVSVERDGCMYGVPIRHGTVHSVVNGNAEGGAGFWYLACRAVGGMG